MVLEGIAHAAYGIGAAAVAGNNWETDEVFTHLAVGTRENRANQAFERQFRAIDFKIGRQALHREDIRDLVELTTQRMGIYHIVGTLLLTFCITWYTDNEILRSKLPTWYADLFLISNFAAVGYLILSVWLAMYAAIASRSIGTRLLTSFARLSFPSRDTVESIKVPLFFDFDRLKRNFLRGSQPSASDVEYAPGGLVRSEGEELSEDDQQHFRKFLQELPKWLSYDTGSRVCMSFGMNQMLQALSYYVLGVIWSRSPMAAVTSFLAVKMLSMIILWLDVGDAHSHHHDMLALIFLHLGPPALAALLTYSTIDPTILHWEAEHSHTKEYLQKLGFLATLCFWGHAGWLWYIYVVTMKEGKRGTRFKASEFANVLEWVNCNAVRQDFLEDVNSAYKHLQTEVAQTTQKELAGGVVSSKGRQTDRLVELYQKLRAAQEVLANGDPHPSKDVELWRSDQTLKRYEVWAKAPKMLAALEGLRHGEVQQRLTHKECRSVDSAYHSFLQLCQQQELGICAQGRDADLGARRRSRAPLVALQVPPEDACVIEMTKDATQSVWIDTRTGEVLSLPPEDQSRITSFNVLINIALPEWQSAAQILALQVPRPPKDDADSDVTPPPPPQPCKFNGGGLSGNWTASRQSEVSAAPDDLPTKLIWFFTMGTIVWWCASGCLHAFIVLMEAETSLESLANATGPIELFVNNAQPLELQWPEPAGLFKVESLHCDDAFVWISNSYSLYQAVETPALLMTNASDQKNYNSLGTLQEVQEVSVHGSICAPFGCDVLRRAPDEGMWLLESAKATSNHVMKVSIPGNWRHVTGRWAGCQSYSSRLCQSASIAGWDGRAVLVGALRWSWRARSWAAHTRFALDPALGLCPQGPAMCNITLRKNETYDDVKALAIDGDGQHLSVLLQNGVVDVWDLSRGTVLERLRLDGDFSAMCQSGFHLLLSQQTRSGPSLVAVRTPVGFTELSNTSHSAAPNTSFSDMPDTRFASMLAEHHGQSMPTTVVHRKHHGVHNRIARHTHPHAGRFLGPALVQFGSTVTRRTLHFSVMHFEEL